MRSFDGVSQKIKGKTQQLKGEVEDTTGNHWHGFWDKTRGKVNETIADIKMNNIRNKDIN